MSDVDTFMLVTGVDSQDVARGYIQISGGDPIQAIQTFYDNPELQASFHATPAAPSVTVTSSHNEEPPPRPRGGRLATGREDSSGVVHIDSDDDDDDGDDDDDVQMIDDDTNIATIAKIAQEEEDAAMARRLQEELYGLGSGDTGDGVRAPIAQTTETLAGPSHAWAPMEEDREAAVLEQLRARQSRQQQRRNRNPANPFDQAPSIWDDGSVPPIPLNPDADQSSRSRAAMLRDLFRPPHELISDATWDEARDEGKVDKKWIMVNLQDLDVFQCQVLNRDVWKDENIKGLVKEHFIFLQYDKREGRAQSYIQLYFPNGAHENSDNYPHLSIIDPRTGEQVKVWSGKSFPTPGELYGDLIEFLDRYSLAANSKNPVVQSKPKRQPIDVGRLTEDEMLQLAMQNSLEANGGSSESSVQDPDMLTKHTNDSGKGKGKAIDVITDLTGDPAQELPSSSGEPAESAFSGISSTNPHVEPGNHPATTTRIQFRHSGGRVIRRFAVTEKIRRIYEWLKAEPFEGKEGVLFELKTMPAGADLINQLDKTIEEAGLKQGTVMIEFIED
ncbi:putative ubx domain protein [Rosellinia necatrix]|uniref:Putative ubx domain protein n=1 Tax=Rosellinia necatrix TaxID=77044 RepID=A0A1W2TDM9_ROSNE|nr:putative ubx domain protein [Rosellinia necatrix]